MKEGLVNCILRKSTFHLCVKSMSKLRRESKFPSMNQCENTPAFTAAITVIGLFVKAGKRKLCMCCYGTYLVYLQGNPLWGYDSWDFPLCLNYFGPITCRKGFGLLCFIFYAFAQQSRHVWSASKGMCVKPRMGFLWSADLSCIIVRMVGTLVDTGGKCSQSFNISNKHAWQTHTNILGQSLSCLL